MFDSIDTRLHVSKDSIVHAVRTTLRRAGFSIVGTDLAKPWGVELKIAPDQAGMFRERMFVGREIPEAFMEAIVGPKLMLIEHGRRLSWHVHERKDALVRILRGFVEVSMSPNDEEPMPVLFNSTYKPIRILPGVRHRLASKGVWAIVAEIAIDVFPEHPSDDTDTRRISDDHGRIA